MLHRFTVPAEDQGSRADLYLHRQLPEISRGNIKKIIDLGGLHIDGRRTRKAGRTLTSGEKIELHRDLRPLQPYRIMDDEVVFQDKHLIVLNKPAGVETQPTPARYKGTLFEALQVYLGRDRRFGRKLEIGMAQRLDRDTSGVLAFSIHPAAHKGFSNQIQQRQVTKNYLALCQGRLAQSTGEFRSLLAKARKQNIYKSVTKGGKEAVTRFTVVHQFKEFSLVNIELVTGRTHQIRAHFSEAGHPLLGDQQYGGVPRLAGVEMARHLLHSHRLRLNHPVSGQQLAFTAPLPKDFTTLLRAFEPEQLAPGRGDLDQLSQA